MSERLTDEQLDDVIKRITCADDCPKCTACGGDGSFQDADGRNWRCTPCEGTGMFALSTQSMVSICRELRSLRQAALTTEEREALKFAADILRDSDISAWVLSAPNPTDGKRRALTILDKLLADGKG